MYHHIALTIGTVLSSNELLRLANETVLYDGWSKKKKEEEEEEGESDVSLMNKNTPFKQSGEMIKWLRGKNNWVGLESVRPLRTYKSCSVQGCICGSDHFWLELHFHWLMS